ncbi:MAG: DNA-binding response regulator [Desulfobacterium sp.]|nr:DNA-binding response regulator [Desulfobacterium sp.]
MTIQLAIVEDDPLLIYNLKMLLDGELNISVVAAYASAEDCLEGLGSCTPNIMLVDLGLPGISGIDLITVVRSRNLKIEMLAYTVFDDRDSLFSALKAGANGYILKGCKPLELIEALNNLHAGGAPMSPQIARKVINEFHEQSLEEQYLLTRREREILIGIGKGLSYKEISAKLNISANTVHTHISTIYKKLQAKNRKEALLTARKKGII